MIFRFKKRQIPFSHFKFRFFPFQSRQVSVKFRFSTERCTTALLSTCHNYGAATLFSEEQIHNTLTAVPLWRSTIDLLRNGLRKNSSQHGSLKRPETAAWNCFHHLHLKKSLKELKKTVNYLHNKFLITKILSELG